MFAVPVQLSNPIPITITLMGFCAVAVAVVSHFHLGQSSPFDPVALCRGRTFSLIELTTLGPRGVCAMWSLRMCIFTVKDGKNRKKHYRACRAGNVPKWGENSFQISYVQLV